MAGKRSGPAELLTFAGRLVLIGSMAAFFVVLYFLAAGTIPDLPSGVYPWAMWTIPSMLAGLLIFVVVSRVLEILGIQIYRKKKD
jgi:hypothetical protein